ncbi:hypothetical protein N1851_026800 [Merluccius polli]|uniref:Uncharacterized protein n=1 Tax=Merluccius polli TaxID=89951 RepID=A0AA47NSQ0_MERPO|nr:hypothetical protein N1851_026800 [Merluccius polli]
MVAVVEEVEAMVSRSDPPILSPSGFIKDLPLKSVIDGQTLDFEYGEYVSGDIDVVSDMHLKPPGYETFEQFYSHGHVGLNDGLHSVKSIVDTNRSRFEINGDELDNIQNSVDPGAVLEDAWCELCPEQEQERLQCLEERNDNEQPLDEPVEGIPDLAVVQGQVRAT